MQTVVDRWVMRPVARPSAHLRLFCFPFAGGGASTYAAWGARLPQTLEICAVQPPGREGRFQELSFTDMDALVTAAAEAIHPLLDVPYALFGCSHGAAVAFECARALRREGLPAPLRLFVAARMAPHCAIPITGLHSASDEVLLEYVRELQGGVQKGLADRSLQQLMLPALRADLAMHEKYVYAPGRPLACPITAIGGTSDATVAHDQLDAWRLHTVTGFERHLLAGGHLFIQTARDALLTTIRRALS